ncbi:MAG: LPS export ABC transporter periplasmic protein LptC [Candidatus Desulfofervidaceae bacterium]|nr:LPS export ABC transporter periplasmic protein LptC [Candidatus Desulfofervidaceae bacterium]
MKNKFWRFVIIGLLVNLFLITGIYIKTRTTPISPKELTTSLTTLKDVYYRSVKNGVKCWEIKAEEAKKVDNKNEYAILKNIKATFFPKNGNPLHLSGNKGILNLKTKELEIKGNVRIWRDDGYRFWTDHLYYSDSRHLLFTDAPVSLEETSLKLTAQGMKFFIKENKLILCQNVKTHFYSLGR